jgi:hypothetical protein
VAVGVILMIVVMVAVVVVAAAVVDLEAYHLLRLFVPVY